MTQEKILEVRDLIVKFKVRNTELTAIRGIDLDLFENEVLALVGESGSGKSVLTKTFTGMLEKNGYIPSGTITYKGNSLEKLNTHREWAPYRGKELATIFQDPMTSLNPVRTIGSQISEVIIKHQKLSEREAKKLAIDLMGKVGILEPEKRYGDYPFEYSGGMRQRVVIAIALACRPKVLICDEPTTALDVTIQAQILRLIKDLQKEYGFTTIFITHDLGVVAQIADRVAVMYAGQIVETGTVEDIFYDPRHPYTWALLSSLPQLSNSEEDLFSIPGTPPSLYTAIKGDAFAPRNPYALQIDYEEEPENIKISDTHYARTWLLDPRAPKAEKPELIQDLHEKLKAAHSQDAALREELANEQ